MSKTTVVISEEKLKAVSLPQATETYTVISHEFIVNHVREGLTQRGFNVLSSEYRANHNGEVARGVHVVQYGDDPDMKMIFSWVNSYDKSTKFQCGVGAQVNANESYILAEGMTNWIRKHTGSADTEAAEVIDDQLSKAEEYFISLVDCKNKMKDVIISPIHFYHLLGRLYFTNAISTQQLSAIKFEMKNSRFVYGADSESLWVMYNHILVVLKSAHPKTWMKQQTHIHYTILNEFDILNYQVQETEMLEEVEVVDPLLENYGEPENQTNLLTQIAEVTGDTSVLEPAGSKPFVEVLEEKMIEQVNEDNQVLEEMIWGETSNEEVLEEVVEEEELEEIIEEITETAPERVKFAVDLTEEDLTPVEEEELVEEEIIEETPFITDEEEDMIMDQMLTPIEAARDSFDAPKEATVDLSDLEGEYSLDEIPEVIETIQERIEEAQEIEIEDYTEVEQKDEELPEIPVDTEIELEFSFNPITEEPEELQTEAEPKAVVEEDHDEDFHVKNVLANELEELFGKPKDFTYKLSGEKYVITFEDNTTVELDKEYIDLLL